MKPVVSSLIALAIAIAPLSAMAAKPTHKTPHAQVAKTTHHKIEKSDKSEKSEKGEKEKASPIVRVKAGKIEHGKKGAKPAVLHHAHNVDLGGAGHKEPKVDAKESGSNSSSAIVNASMTTKTPMVHGKTAHKDANAKPAAAKPAAMPKLPNPNAGKPSKGGAEKGARKPAEKKAAEPTSSDANDGEPKRDEELAELVARIRGHHPDSATPEKADEHAPPPAPTPTPTPTPTPNNSDKDKGSDNTKTGEKGAKNISHTTKASPPPPCVKEPVEIIRGPEVERFELTKCEGGVAPLAVEHLSILIRPGGAARPTAPLAELAKKPGPEIAHGIRRVDPRLVERIQSVVDHFSKPNAPAKIFVISGYRPMSVGSMHSTGRAIDFRVEGAKNEDVVSFCKTLGDTGCGFYPNSSFVHVDVRDAGAGHVTWIDASGPGETPRYVSTWPPPPVAARHIQKASASSPSESSESDLAKEGSSLLRARRPLDREAAPEAVDTHPADVAP